jgi:hypothetical protein
LNTWIVVVLIWQDLYLQQQNRHPKKNMCYNEIGLYVQIYGQHFLFNCELDWECHVYGKLNLENVIFSLNSGKFCISTSILACKLVFVICNC